MTLLTVNQTLARTGLPRITLYRRLWRNEFPKPRSYFGRSPQFAADDVDTWIRCNLGRLAAP